MLTWPVYFFYPIHLYLGFFNKMAPLIRLDDVSIQKLNETYDTLYELQDRLVISKEYLSNTTRNPKEDLEHSEGLKKLLSSSEIARDNIITWYLRKPNVHLNVTISLLTAKIKLIEYKLKKCNGLDLHRACSLSLVDFCNILSDMTMHNEKKSERKTMQKVSEEAGIPIWLSHYRNQICHVPSESPCISILVPLVSRSLEYLRDSYWAKILNRGRFDPQSSKKLIRFIANHTHISSVNHQLCVKKDVDNVNNRTIVNVQKDIALCSKSCWSLRKKLLRYPDQVMDILTKFLIAFKPNSQTKNCALLFEQILLTKNFERFIFKLIVQLETQPYNKKVALWLRLTIAMAGWGPNDKIRNYFRRLGLCATNKIQSSIDIPPIKCFRILYKVIHLDDPIKKLLVRRLRKKIEPILGKEGYLMLEKITRIAA